MVINNSNIINKQQNIPISMAYYTQKQMKQIIEDHNFRSEQKFNSDPICIKYLINYVKQVTITQTSLLLILKLIKFYKFPILIFMQSYYHKIHEGYIEYYHQQLNTIYYLVKQIIKQDQFQQLLFFSKSSTLDSTNYRKKIKYLTIFQENFINYAYNISKMLSKIRKLLKIIEQKIKQPEIFNKNIQHLINKYYEYKQQMINKIEQHHFEYEGKMILQNFNIKYIQSKFYSYLEKIQHFFYQSKNYQQSFLSTSKFIQQNNHTICHDNHDHQTKENSNYFAEFYDEQFQEQQKQRQSYQHDQFNEYSSVTRTSNYQNNYSKCSSSPRLSKDNLFLINKRIKPPSLSQRYHLFQAKHSKKFSLTKHLCCRKSLTLSQPLIQTNIQVFSFYQVTDIYNKQLATNLKSDICSMLNHKGGSLFLGIKYHAKNQQPFVEGISILQLQKQDISSYFRHLSQSIKPDIVVHNRLFEINYIPIQERQNNYKEQHGNNYIPGLWGSRDEIYSYQVDGQDFFCFRNEKGKYFLQGRNLLKVIKTRFNQPLPIPKTIHEGPCQKPYRGSPLYKRSLITNKIEKICQQFEKNKKSNTNINQHRSTNNELSKKSVFRVAYDFLIIGVSQQKIEQIFEKQNYKTKVYLQNLGPGITYMRNIHAQLLKSTKQILKNIYQYLNYRYQKYQIIPLSKYINIDNKDTQYCQNILYNYGCTNFQYLQNYQYVILKFYKTYYAALAYLLMKDHQISCEFTFSDNN